MFNEIFTTGMPPILSNWTRNENEKKMVSYNKKSFFDQKLERDESSQKLFQLIYGKISKNYGKIRDAKLGTEHK